MNDITELVDKLLSSISAKDVKLSIAYVQEFKSKIATDSNYIGWITTPANLTLVQTALTTHLGIPHKALMIRVRPGCSRGLRASLFLQAMENSLNRLQEVR